MIIQLVFLIKLKFQNQLLNKIIKIKCLFNKMTKINYLKITQILFKMIGKILKKNLK